MENALYVALSRQNALRQQMDVIANNLANMNTTAYRSESILFQEYLNKDHDKLGRSRDISYVQDFGTVRNFSQGAMNPTGNQFDVAISGNGYLTVETPDGKEAFTRHGQLHLNEEGQLVDTNGYPVLDVDDQIIVIDEAGGPVDINNEGTLTNDLGEIARLKVVEFQSEYALKARGGGLYETDVRPELAQDSAVLQGTLEGSNVNAIVEMTKMIDVSRAYEQTTNLLTKTEGLEKDAIRRLGSPRG